MSNKATMMVTPHNRSEPVTIGLSVPCGGGNFSLIVGMSVDEAPMKAAATPAAPFVHVPICNVANHTFRAAGVSRRVASNWREAWSRGRRSWRRGDGREYRQGSRMD